MQDVGAMREHSQPTWIWQWEKLALRPQTLHRNILCTYKCMRNSKWKLVHLVTYAAATLVNKWKIIQDLITGTDISCITETLPADTQGLTLPHPFPHAPDTFIDLEKDTEALHSSSLLISNAREMTQPRPPYSSSFIWHLKPESKPAHGLYSFIKYHGWTDSWRSLPSPGGKYKKRVELGLPSVHSDWVTDRNASNLMLLSSLRFSRDICGFIPVRQSNPGPGLSFRRGQRAKDIVT